MSLSGRASLPHGVTLILPEDVVRPSSGDLDRAGYTSAQLRRASGLSSGSERLYLADQLITTLPATLATTLPHRFGSPDPAADAAAAAAALAIASASAAAAAAIAAARAASPRTPNPDHRRLDASPRPAIVRAGTVGSRAAILARAVSPFIAAPASPRVTRGRTVAASAHRGSSRFQSRSRSRLHLHGDGASVADGTPGSCSRSRSRTDADDAADAAAAAARDAKAYLEAMRAHVQRSRADSAAAALADWGRRGSQPEAASGGRGGRVTVDWPSDRDRDSPCYASATDSLAGEQASAAAMAAAVAALAAAASAGAGSGDADADWIADLLNAPALPPDFLATAVAASRAREAAAAEAAAAEVSAAAARAASPSPQTRTRMLRSPKPPRSPKAPRSPRSPGLLGRSPGLRARAGLTPSPIPGPSPVPQLVRLRTRAASPGLPSPRTAAPPLPPPPPAPSETLSSLFSASGALDLDLLARAGADPAADVAGAGAPGSAAALGRAPEAVPIQRLVLPRVATLAAGAGHGDAGSSPYASVRRVAEMLRRAPSPPLARPLAATAAAATTTLFSPPAEPRHAPLPLLEFEIAAASAAANAGALADVSLLSLSPSVAALARARSRPRPLPLAPASGSLSASPAPSSVSAASSFAASTAAAELALSLAGGPHSGAGSLRMDALSMPFLLGSLPPPPRSVAPPGALDGAAADADPTHALSRAMQRQLTARGARPDASASHSVPAPWDTELPPGHVAPTPLLRHAHTLSQQALSACNGPLQPDLHAPQPAPLMPAPRLPGLRGSATLLTAPGGASYAALTVALSSAPSLDPSPQCSPRPLPDASHVTPGYAASPPSSATMGPPGAHPSVYGGTALLSASVSALHLAHGGSYADLLRARGQFHLPAPAATLVPPALVPPLGFLSDAPGAEVGLPGPSPGRRHVRGRSDLATTAERLVGPTGAPRSAIELAARGGLSFSAIARAGTQRRRQYLEKQQAASDVIRGLTPGMQGAARSPSPPRPEGVHLAGAWR